jgi:hypothetical protein
MRDKNKYALGGKKEAFTLKSPQHTQLLPYQDQFRPCLQEISSPITELNLDYPNREGDNDTKR